MNFNDVDDIRRKGFLGFRTIAELWTDRVCIPTVMGVYLVMNLDDGEPKFINPGVGGFFKGKNPNVSMAELKMRYVPKSKVVYIGKAGSKTGKATLHARLGQYLRFGQGKNVGHWGGRLIWQLRNHSELVICWKPTPDHEPREVECSLIDEYIVQFGRKPFANLVG